MPPPAAGVDVELGVGDGVGDGVGIVVQVSLNSAVRRVISVISTKPSGGSGATSRRAGAFGGGPTGSPKWFVKAVMSVTSENVSLLISAGQALSVELSAHASRGSVPIVASALSDQPSPSVSVTASARVACPGKPAAPTLTMAKRRPRIRAAQK
jgi:hypothetical protein